MHPPPTINLLPPLGSRENYPQTYPPISYQNIQYHTNACTVPSFVSLPSPQAWPETTSSSYKALIRIHSPFKSPPSCSFAYSLTPPSLLTIVIAAPSAQCTHPAKGTAPCNPNASTVTVYYSRNSLWITLPPLSEEHRTHTKSNLHCSYKLHAYLSHRRLPPANHLTFRLPDSLHNRTHFRITLLPHTTHFLPANLSTLVA